ncbi:MAG: hypothetical protein ABR907_17705 [Terracidiphilus sp.]|jgi:hypothetical protein
MSGAAALVVAVAMSGCGSTTYFAGRTLPPSGLTNRVLITIQNPSPSTSGLLEFVDAFYDIRYKYNSTNTGPQFAISGFSAKLPTTIQNMPEERLGAVYGSGDGSYSIINYAKEITNPPVSLNGLSASVFDARNQQYVVAASQSSHILTFVNRLGNTSYPLSLPGVYRVSLNPGGSVALAFVQNSNYIYYPRQLTASEAQAYSGGPSTWPVGAEDCEPQNLPGMCLFQVLDPSTGKPLAFNRPVKAVFSADGGTAYILSCGPECGGTSAPVTGFPATAAVSQLPVAPLIFLLGQQSGSLPTQSALNSGTLGIPGGASNALVDGSTLYIAGQQQQADGFWGGYLTVVGLPSGQGTSMTAAPPISISDGAPGAISRMMLADDDTIWIGMTKCTNGERGSNGLPYGCLTMVNTTTNAATLLPYNGDATGIAAITGLHKIYTVEGGQIYIYSTVNGTAIDNSNVTVTGTAYDVAYMDALTDTNNTVY